MKEEKRKEEKRKRIYSGPAWAWDVLFDTLDCDSQSIAFDLTLRKKIRKALDAVFLQSVER